MKDFYLEEYIFLKIRLLRSIRKYWIEIIEKNKIRCIVFKGYINIFK